MPPYARSVLVVALACLAGGCGTVCNLMAPPTSTRDDVWALGLNTCKPFNGVRTSVIMGSFMLVSVVGSPVGAYAILVDTPLSLAGDVLTLPIARARQRQEPWATWWGEQSTQTPARLPANDPLIAESNRPMSDVTTSPTQATLGAPEPAEVTPAKLTLDP